MADQSAHSADRAAQRAPGSAVRRAVPELGRRVRSGASGLTVVLMATALISTAFGVGAMGRADEVSDGAAWLWNSPTGEVTRVNGNNAEVDLVTSLPDSKGGDVRVTQNDDYLLLHDPATGKVTSVDLREMGFSGALQLGESGDFGLVLGKRTAVVIDRAGGEIKAVDPATLQPTGASLQIPGPLVGGAFDDTDTLWLGVPTQGTAVGIRVEGEDAAISQTVSVADPGSDIAMTVLDDGALAVDRTGKRLVAARNGEDPRLVSSPVPLKGAVLPPRTRGETAAVTVPGSGRIVTVADAGGTPRLGHFAVRHKGGGTAVPFGGRVYVPFEGEGAVRVFTPEGKELNPVRLPGAEGPLEVEAREGHLFVNAPDAGVAAVVDPSGKASVIDKTQPPPGKGQGPGGIAASADGATPGAQGPPAPDGGEPGDAPGTPPPSGTGDDEERDEPESTDAPGAPTPVTAEAGDGAVTLSWPKAYSPDAPVQTYTVTWKGGSTTLDGSARSAEIDGLDNGTAYRFRVRAANEHGTGPAAQTEEVTPGPGALSAPADVGAEATGSDTATVSWQAVDGAADYVVTADREGVSDRTSTRTSVDFSGLEPGATYTFTVTPRTDGGVSGEPATSEPITMPELELGAPASVTFETAADAVTVDWSAVEGAAEYRITPGGDGAAALPEATASQTTYTYRPRGAGRCYSFTVLAIGPGGTAAESSTTSDARCAQDFN
ncbi:fibronectin type III domain-containing protein [Streptomonospora wellingtoniae]|uniref:Fibronectin type III domain-containing protein n=1 Tax=Streptomonospora wellingtoniae TaxID=3075544 RepID=A0ABU2KTG6_9ACTN|nr:fibronectin type III domain-containing protein [Streptomonospora sp. DSM 45055]MDT0302501.1 fibronectin type III domain-containing protein [Streptomonospora sp. DSM 45055]